MTNKQQSDLDWSQEFFGHYLINYNCDPDGLERFEKQYLVSDEGDGCNEFRFDACFDAKGKILNYGVGNYYGPEIHLIRFRN